MVRKQRYLECLPVFLILSGLAVYAFTLAQQPLPELTGDPHNIMQRSLRVARTGDIFSTIDPPLRYVPLAAIFRLLGIQETGAQAEFITHFYSTLLSFVAVPLALYLLFRETIDNRVATLTVLGFAIWRVFGIGLSPYEHGYWMYDYAIPFVYLALLLLHRTVLATAPGRKLLLAGATGFIIGVVGLTQYILGAYTSLIAVVLFALHDDYRELAVTGGIGAIMASSLYFMSDYAIGLIFSTGSGRLTILGLATLPGRVAATITTPAYLLPIALAIGVLGLYRVTSARPSETGVLLVSLSILGIIWLSIFVTSRWFSLLAQYAGQYLLLGVFIHQSLTVLDEHYNVTQFSIGSSR